MLVTRASLRGWSSCGRSRMYPAQDRALASRRARWSPESMFEEAQLYSPVTQRADGSVEVHLGENHPGFADPVYRARRNEIAAAAMAWAPGDPVPQIAYSD